MKKDLKAEAVNSKLKLAVKNYVENLMDRCVIENPNTDLKQLSSGVHYKQFSKIYDDDKTIGQLDQLELEFDVIEKGIQQILETNK